MPPSVQPHGKIRIGSAQPAFGKQDSDLCGQNALTLFRRIYKHMGKPGGQGQSGNVSTMRCRPTIRIQRTERGEPLSCFGKGG